MPSREPGAGPAPACRQDGRVPWIELDGAVNVRDLGSLTTDDGRTTVPRRLLRADNLQDLSPADVRLLVDEHGADHRGRPAQPGGGRVRGTWPADPGRVGPACAPLGAAGVRQGHRRRRRGAGRPQGRGPLPRRPALRSLPRLPGGPAGAGGRRAAQRSPRRPGAALVHCAAGKDRTGVVVALALTVAGVGRETVIADYTATAERIGAVLSRLRASKTYAADLDTRPDDDHKPRRGDHAGAPRADRRALRRGAGLAVRARLRPRRRPGALRAKLLDGLSRAARRGVPARVTRGCRLVAGVSGGRLRNWPMIPCQGCRVTGSSPAGPPRSWSAAPRRPGRAGAAGWSEKLAATMRPPARYDPQRRGRRPAPRRRRSGRRPRRGAGRAGRGRATASSAGSSRWSATLRAAVSPSGQPGRHAAGGEPGRRGGVPLHRGPAAVPAALPGRSPSGHLVAAAAPAAPPTSVIADLVAVVQHDGARQGGQHQQGEPGLALVAAAPAAREPADVVVGRRPHRAGPGGQRARASRPTTPDRSARGERGEHEREVERELQLVVVAVERGQAGQVAHPGLAEQQPRRRRSRRRSAASPGTRRASRAGSRCRPARWPNRPAERVRGWSSRRVVAQLRVLVQAVRHVDAEPGHAAVEPEPEDLVELLGAPRARPPVQVGLAGQEHGAGSTGRSARRASRRSARSRRASCSAGPPPGAGSAHT